jgi:pilus assembly protein Flp/PilA
MVSKDQWHFVAIQPCLEIMNYLKKLAYGLLVEEDGPTAVEYAVMLAVIIVACIGAVLSTGDVQQSLFVDTGDSMNNAIFPSN